MTDVGEVRVISFLWVRTEGQRQTRFWNHHMETCRHKKKKKKNSTQSSKFGVSCRSLYASPEYGDA